MASVPFHCEKCHTRRSPSEPISALGDLAVGLCCLPKKETALNKLGNVNLQALYNELKNKNHSDYDIFVDNGWQLKSEEAWKQSKAYNHPSLDGLSYEYLSSLCKAVTRSPYNHGPGIIWVIFGRWSFTKQIFWRLYHTAPFDSSYITNSDNRGKLITDLDIYLKDNY